MIKKIKSMLKDPNLDYRSKSFILLSVIALIGLFIALISGILLGQALSANVSLVIELVLFISIFLWAIYHNGIGIAKIVIAAFLMFVFLPVAFFTSGGAAGGTPVWFMFTTLYVVMTLSGKPKVFFLISNMIVVAVCWWIGYTRPETVTEFTRTEAYIDSFFTLLIVGVVMTALVGYQAILFTRENDRVNDQKKKIEELSRSQSRFFTSVSHEIRTPINAILGFNEVMLRKEDLSDDLKSDASAIQGAGRMLLSLINDLLDFSRLEAGRMNIVPVEYKLGELMPEIVNMVVLQARTKGLGFEAELDPDAPAGLMGDSVRIRQIIINLLNNAVKYTKKGSVRIEVKTESVDDKRVMLVCKVSDTGIGIREEVIPTLFDAFARMDQEKNINIEGTGLGLYIVKQLIDLMEGEISVESVYGEGTTFTVRIPQGVSDATKIGSINILDHADRRNVYRITFAAPDARILIVDDVKMNLTVEKKLLEETQMRIDTALSGREALELTEKNRYDIILMDHLMPEMDGIECLKLIRSQAGGMCTDIPVLVLSANVERNNTELYTEAGFAGQLVKPISGRTLVEAILQHLPPEKIVEKPKESAESISEE